MDSVFKKQDDARDLWGAVNEKFEDILRKVHSEKERKKEKSGRRGRKGLTRGSNVPTKDAGCRRK